MCCISRQYLCRKYAWSYLLSVWLLRAWEQARLLIIQSHLNWEHFVLTPSHPLTYFTQCSRLRCVAFFTGWDTDCFNTPTCLWKHTDDIAVQRCTQVVLQHARGKRKDATANKLNNIIISPFCSMWWAALQFNVDLWPLCSFIMCVYFSSLEDR